MTQHAIDDCQRIVSDLKYSDGVRSLSDTLQKFDDLSNTICKCADLFEFLRHSSGFDNTEALRGHAILSEYVQCLNTDAELYDRLRSAPGCCADGGGELLDVDSSMLASLLKDFEQSGINMTAERRSRFVALSNELNSLVPAYLDGCEQPVRTVRDNERFGRGYEIHEPDLFNPDGQLRQLTYMEYFNEANLPEQLNTFERILSCRRDIAHVCGYKSYAHRATCDALLDSPSRVQNFIDSISENTATGLDAELKRLRKTANNNPVRAWDVPYLMDKFKRGTWPFEYFSLGTCMDAVKMVAESNLGLRIGVSATDGEQLWHPSVVKLEVLDDAHLVRGHIYCDLLERPGKEALDCHFTIRCSKTLAADGSRQTPIVVLHTSFPTATNNGMCFLSRSMLGNLFHEFGHTFHSIMSLTPYQHLSGTRGTTDLAEVPSQYFESMIDSEQLLRMIGKHWVTGDPLSDSCNLRDDADFPYYHMAEQLFTSQLDLQMHLDPSSFLDPLSRQKIVTEQASRLMHLSYPPASYLRSPHFVDYGSKYHSYLVSKAIAMKLRQMTGVSSELTNDKRMCSLLSMGGQLTSRDLAEYCSIADEFQLSKIICDGLISDNL